LKKVGIKKENDMWQTQFKVKEKVNLERDIEDIGENREN
jgi:hypothetical protein